MDNDATVFAVVLSAVSLTDERVVHLLAVMHECQLYILFYEPSSIAYAAFFLRFKPTTVAEFTCEDYVMETVVFAFDRANLTDTVAMGAFPEPAGTSSRAVVAQAPADVLYADFAWAEQLFVT